MDKGVYYGFILKGDLLGALDYMKQFPSQKGTYDRYLSIFKNEKYQRYDLDDSINEIMAAYQSYYRDIFYLRLDSDAAEEILRVKLLSLIGAGEPETPLCELEREHIPALFRSRGFHFMGGKTSGFYGPYVWKSTETVTYDVELPDGVQSYHVKLLDGFVTRSWIDYLSLGAIGPGGWTDGDGIINCVKSAWDLQSEAFQISLLKHEAQHARDLASGEEMTSAELEYRAKLVELIYTHERNLLEQFAREADDSQLENGHTVAAARIVCDFADYFPDRDFTSLDPGEIRWCALELFRRDSDGRRMDERD